MHERTERQSVLMKDPVSREGGSSLAGPVCRAPMEGFGSCTGELGLQRMRVEVRVM